MILFRTNVTRYISEREISMSRIDWLQRQRVQGYWQRMSAAVVFITVLIVTSCSFLTGSRRIVGKIDPPNLSILRAPSAVKAKQTFVISVTTAGGGCVTPEGAEVHVSRLTAEVTPYDRVRGNVCDAALHGFPRDVTLQFDSPGLATVRVIGVNQTGERVVVESQILVRPQ